MEIFLGWLFFSIVAGVIAGSKGRSGFGYFLLSIFLSPLIGLLLAIGMPAITPETGAGGNSSQPTPDTHVKCPDCRELVLKDARKCKHCGCALIPEAEQTEEQIMAKHGIAKNGRLYIYKEWRYDNLKDAVRQAEKA